jgi:glycosyltransferase involved in cell wall biosynthesis
VKELLVSLIVPVYNTVQYLDELYQSLVAQSISDFEAIFIDDGSTDGSSEKLLELTNQDNRFSVYHQKNSGQGVARNLGFSKSTGRYVMFVDSDDVLHDRCLEYCLASVQKSGADFFQFRFRKGVTPSDITASHYQSASVHCISIREAIFTAWPISPCSLIRRDLLERSGIKFPSYKYEDNVEIPRIISFAQKVVLSDAELYYYRTNEFSTVHNPKNLPDLLLAADGLLVLAEEIPLFYSEFVYRSYGVLRRFLEVGGVAEKRDEVSRRLLQEPYTSNPYVQIPKRIRESYESSLSWKLSAPIRWIGDLCDKVRHS